MNIGLREQISSKKEDNDCEHCETLNWPRCLASSPYIILAPSNNCCYEGYIYRPMAFTYQLWEWTMKAKLALLHLQR
jgi:hypothetical protein